MTLHSFPTPEVEAETREITPELLERAKRMVDQALAEQDPPLWMYAIQAGGYGCPIKLGITRDPVGRLRTLQCGSAEQLRGVAAWRALAFTEKQLHEEFADCHLRGEWFMHSLPLWRLVRALGGDFRWER